MIRLRAGDKLPVHLVALVSPGVLHGSAKLTDTCEGDSLFEGLDIDPKKGTWTYRRRSYPPVTRRIGEGSRYDFLLGVFALADRAHMQAMLKIALEHEREHVHRQYPSDDD